MICVVKLIAKHLPLLALALLVSSTKLRAEELPFRAGNTITIVKAGESGGICDRFMVLEIKGKWVKAETLKWYNSDQFLCVEIR